MVYFLAATVLVLVVAVIFLYTEKTRVLSDNHTLILQNDSIIAEHINLKHQLLEEQFRGPNGEGMSSLHQLKK